MKEVKSAIHVKDDITWAICTTDISYTNNVDSVIPIYQKLIAAKKYTILVYSGDTDGAVPYVGTYKWIESLKLPAKAVWDEWVIPKWNGQQVAGYKSEYEGLTFTTVKGSGESSGDGCIWCIQ